MDIPQDSRARLLAHLLSHAEYDPALNCINYTGYKTPKGYGRQSFRLGDRMVHVRVHRAMWILTHGPIGDPTLVVDHFCGNRGCINPELLELITNEENLHRGDDRHGQPRREFGRYRVKQDARVPARNRSACVHGHSWPKYLRLRTMADGKQHTYCVECKRLSENRRKQASRSESLPQTPIG